MTKKTYLVFCLIVLFFRGIGVAQHHHHLSTLIPPNTATHTAIKSGNWHDPTTWSSSTVPSDAAIVVIPQNSTVTYESDATPPHIFAIRVDGEFICKQSDASKTTKLKFDTFLGMMTSKVKFHTNNSSDGMIDIAIAPFDIEEHKDGNSGFSQTWNANAQNHFSDDKNTYKVTYTINGDDRYNSYEQAVAGDAELVKSPRTLMKDGVGVLGRFEWDSTQLSLGVVTMGELEILGQEKGVMAKLAVDALKNQNQVVLENMPDGWVVGDSILITLGGNIDATSNGNETAKIATIAGNTITTTANLYRNHQGRAADNLHCYVGNLNRNIRFRSNRTDKITVRGHLMAMHNPTNVQIKNARFQQMGRTDKSRLVDDLIWDKWVEPKVFKSKISALGQECSQLKPAAKEEITNSRGRYSIHIHQTGATNGTNITQVTGNVVQGNPGWGITHHDAHANVSNNVVYQVRGAGIVSEAGNETGFWDNNLVVDIALGNNTDIYQPALFFDDYLFKGEGLGMKGRGVVCRGNVIADANFGVGINNLNPATNNLRRMDAAALATLRPNFQIDQFPLSQNGYSKEGDGVMPVEVALIMENTTVINSFRALRSIERDMGVNHESRSVFDEFIAWGANFGLSITYQADYSFKDVFISGKNSDSRGIDLWKYAHNHSFENIKLVDLGYGIVASKLVENDGAEPKTRNNGFTPWLFINLETENVTNFYKLEKENETTSTVYDDHPDNPIFLTTAQLPSPRPMIFTPNNTADLEIDLSTNDLQFKVDGAITDRAGTYEYGIKQALAQGDLRLDYPERIYEFASPDKLKAYLEENGVYKDVNNNNQLYFILKEILVDRLNFEAKSFPIKINIKNAPNTTPYTNAKVETAANLLPKNQLISRAGAATQSSDRGGFKYRDISIDTDAAKATDGNNNGRKNVNFYQRGLAPLGSSSFTKRESEPWWELDLGEQKIIDYIDIWNSVEMNGTAQETPSTHFKNFYVLISDTPFGSSNLTQARNLADHEYYKDANLTQLFSLNNLTIQGRYIRIQAENDGGGKARIGLAEVDVIGRAISGSNDCNGVLNGLAYLDECNECVEGNTGEEPCLQDCNDEWGGVAFLDACITCVGGATNLFPAIEIPCNGVDDDCNPATTDDAPAMDNLNLENETLNHGNYTGGQTIQTNQNVLVKKDTLVQFLAGNSITLKAGFEVKAGALFLAKIQTFEDCSTELDNPKISAIARTNIHESQEEVADNSLEMSVFPNPFKNQTNIQFQLPNDTEVTLDLYNLNGQLIENISKKQWYPKGLTNLAFRLKNPISGMHYLVLKTENTVLTKKILIHE